MRRKPADHSAKTTDLQPGRVVEHRGKSLTVEDSEGSRWLCRIRSRLEPAAVGDQVLWSQSDEHQGRVEQILPRQTVLSRPAPRNRTRPVAANLDQLIAIVAPKPECDLLLLDQYLVICENSDLPVLILLNKCDLAEAGTIQSALAPYSQLGYEVLKISAKLEDGLPALKHHLQQHCSILVGQSGVGKSTLTNRLLPGIELVTREVSDATGHGRHTTTATSLYKLPNGGELIDSPGVNVFGLAEIDNAKLARGYREIARASEACRYHNCQHLNEPGCTVQQQVEQGLIHADRYARYLKLRDKLPKT